MSAIRTNSEGKTLYCIATLNWVAGNWQSKFDYLYATDQGEARYQYTIANTKTLVDGRKKISGIAPMVGVFEDKEGRLYA